MNTNIIDTHVIRYKGLIITIILLLLSLTLMAQEVLFGPENPPPKGANISFTGSANDGLIGRTGGKVYTITNVTLSNSTTVYWSILEESVKLSMDGSSYTGAENMVYNSSLSDLSSGTLYFTGATAIKTYSPSVTTKPLYSRFIITLTTGTGIPVSLVDALDIGLPSALGGLAQISGNEMTLKIKMEMLVSDDGGTSWEPHLDYYDAASTQGSNAYSSYNFGFYWENDPPELENLLVANCDEGDTITIAPLNLSATDVESSNEEISFIANPRTTDTLPDFGAFYLNESSMIYPDTFTMSDIISGNISYIHNGSESIKDSLALMLIDGNEGIYKDINEDSVFYFPISITPVDDPPTLVYNLGGTLKEDSILQISAEMLLTEDPESSPDMITYVLDPEGNSDYPVNGTLFLNTIPLSDGSTFTQEDVSSGLLSYDHNGSQSLTDGFTFSVSDEFGHPAVVGASDIFFFNLEILEVNDPPILTKLYELVIDEGSTGHITNAIIAATDEESNADEISFTIDPDFTITDPLHGIVMLDDVELGDGDKFTMADINNNKLKYIHDGSEEAHDFIPFNVSDPDGGIAHDGEYTIFHLNISISNVNDLPTLENPIEDQTIRANSTFDFSIPENTFNDVDPEDELTYSATLTGDEDLPDWLIFTPANRNFSGDVPESAKNTSMIIIVLAKDRELEEVRDTFELFIQSPLAIEQGRKHAFNIYPNPCSEYLNISFAGEYSGKIEIDIKDILGKTVISEYLHPKDELRINLKGKADGLYIIKIKSKEGDNCLKFYKKE